MTTDQRTRITVTMPPELHQQLLEACKQDDLPIVYWVRGAIREKLNRSQTSNNEGHFR